MQDESKGKIHITPKGNRFIQKSSFNNRDIDECKQDIKRLRKQVSRLMYIAEHEESILEQNQGKQIFLNLTNGTTETGLLENITKFQLVLKQDERLVYFYKSGIISYVIG